MSKLMQYYLSSFLQINKHQDWCVACYFWSLVEHSLWKLTLWFSQKLDGQAHEKDHNGSWVSCWRLQHHCWCSCGCGHGYHSTYLLDGSVIPLADLAATPVQNRGFLSPPHCLCSWSITSQRTEEVLFSRTEAPTSKYEEWRTVQLFLSVMTCALFPTQDPSLVFLAMWLSMFPFWSYRSLDMNTMFSLTSDLAFYLFVEARWGVGRRAQDRC